jgi:hypothetical protein
LNKTNLRDECGNSQTIHPRYCDEEESQFRQMDLLRRNKAAQVVYANLRMEIAFDLVPTPRCQACRLDMHLIGVDWETERRDVYTFYCGSCDCYELKRVELH